MKNRKNKKGFTIVELVIVIGVIGILSAILIPTFSSLVNQAKETQLRADIAAAYSMYAADAADGIKDDTSDTSLTFYGQKEVSLSKDSGTNHYVWDATKNEWNLTPVNTGTHTDLSVEYLGWKVYHYVAAQA